MTPLFSPPQALIEKIMNQTRTLWTSSNYISVNLQPSPILKTNRSRHFFFIFKFYPLVYEYYKMVVYRNYSLFIASKSQYLACSYLCYGQNENRNMKYTFHFLIALILSSYQVLSQDDIIEENDYSRSFELFNEGLDYLGDYKDALAIEFMSKAIELNSGNADFYLGRAQTYSLMNMLEEAEKDIVIAIDLAEKQFDLHYNAGNIYFKRKNMELAIEHYTLALEYNDNAETSLGNLANCLFNRGNSYMKVKRYEEAEDDFTKSINIKPDFINAIHNRGIARKNLDLKNDACMDFNTADSLGSHISANYLASFCN